MEQLQSDTTDDLDGAGWRHDGFQVAPGGESAVRVVLDTPGDWLVTCGQAESHPAAILRARTS
jgi:hypothetical protein